MENELSHVDDLKRAETLLAGENRLLEMVASGDPLPVVLDGLCRLVEEMVSDCHCSIHLVDPTGTSFKFAAAPTFPTNYYESKDDKLVHSESGPCGMAASLKTEVIVQDVASETRWDPDQWRAPTLKHGLRSCWATPILSRAEKVLGSFAIYRREPGSPTAFQRELIGQFAHIASIAVERAQSDTALIQSEEIFRAIVETTPECVKVIAHDGTLLRLNAAGLTMTGAESEDVVVGRNFYDFVAPEDRNRYREFNETVCSGHKGFLEFDIISIQCDRRHMETHAAPMRHSDGSVVQLGVTRDITERKKSEEKLRRSEAFLAEAQRISRTGSFSWCVATNEITWSEEAYRIYGLDPAAPVTLEAILSRTHPEDVHLCQQVIDRTRSGVEDFDFERRLVMPDQSVKYLHVLAHVIRNQDGEPELIGTLHDVTGRRLSEEALSRTRSELARVARATSLGAMTASIAHEVNQPLSGIITNASTCLRMLNADPPNVDGARETARRTIRDGSRASDVITRLRALFSKKDAATESVDLNEATREVIALSRSELQKSQVISRVELAEDLPTVIGDRVQLQQVILNLLLNASDAMSGVDDRPRQLVIRTERDEGDRVRLTVEDAGVGLNPQDVDKLFESFYTTKTGGMGIGLSVSRAIIESHGGRLWAGPNAGPGATFSFSIPREPEGATGSHSSGVIQTPAMTEAGYEMRNS